MLQAKTKEQVEHIANILGSEGEMGELPIHSVLTDKPITFDQMKEIVEYLDDKTV